MISRQRPTAVQQGFDLTPDEFQSAGVRLLELVGTALAAERTPPVSPSTDGATAHRPFHGGAPLEGIGLQGVMDAWEHDLMPLTRRNGHPSFFAYVCGSADPIGVFADAFASALNQLVVAWRSSPGAAEIERATLRWLDEMVGFDAGGTGLLVGGGSAANLQAIACALARMEDEGASRKRCTVYLAPDAHVSLRKACRILGVPAEKVRIVATDGSRRLDPDDLERAIARDRASGLIPAVVCASVGTVNTGAVDPLDRIAEVCRRCEVWLHLDGAYGALAAMTSEYAWMKRGIGNADSLALDPHKWLFAPADVGCLLLRRDEDALRAFSFESEYTTVVESDDRERHAFFDRGLEMTRRFRALKVWSIISARGTGALSSEIARNIGLRHHLDACVRDTDGLELLGSGLSVSCFRYGWPGATDTELNAANLAIAQRINEQGDTYLATTRLDGQVALRACIVNFRTQVGDVEELVRKVRETGSAWATKHSRG